MKRFLREYAYLARNGWYVYRDCFVYYRNPLHAAVLTLLLPVAILVWLVVAASNTLSQPKEHHDQVTK